MVVMGIDSEDVWCCPACDPSTLTPLKRKLNEPEPTMPEPEPEWLKRGMVILESVSTHRYAWYFNQPVEQLKLEIPEYHKIIKRPMDLG